jgi:hypothetical protein
MQVLLIADSGNHCIRALDTVSGVTSTWYISGGRTTPELLTPVAVAVVHSWGGERLVYVVDAGYSNRLAVIGEPVVGTLTLTVMGTSGLSPSMLGTGLFPAPALTVGTDGLGSMSMLYLDTTHKLKVRSAYLRLRAVVSYSAR